MMKKILLVAAAALALHGSCFAAGETKLLENYQQVAVKMIDIFDGGTVPRYTAIEPLLSEALKAKFGEAQFEEMKQSIENRYGTGKNFRFALFERLDKIDRVVYFADFPKDPDPVLIGFNFVDGKLDAFIMSSKNAQNQQPAGN